MILSGKAVSEVSNAKGPFEATTHGQPAQVFSVPNSQAQIICIPGCLSGLRARDRGRSGLCHPLHGSNWLSLVALLALTPLLGRFIASVLKGENAAPIKYLLPIEKAIYRVAAIDPGHEMDWKEYLWCLLGINALGLVVVLVIQLAQAHLPPNPQGLPNVPFWLAFNTAVSFITNTNWQNYSGEATLGYLVQMLGLTVQNFLSAATGMAVFLALVAASSGAKARIRSAIFGRTCAHDAYTFYCPCPCSGPCCWEARA